MERILCFYRNSAPDVLITLDLDDIYIAYKKATFIALIINELVSNSFKYASPEEYADKRIRVEARITDDRIGMAFEDNGIGLPMGFSLEEAESIWLSIVLSIIKKELEGELAFHSGPGPQGAHLSGRPLLTRALYFFARP